tara:strand:- start:429 stop:1472 length:1044 start_codon:yes stop_codon:yes gene_type:complete
MNFLACDLGGTKVLLAIYEEISKNSTPELITKKRYLSTEWNSIYEIVEDFLEKECKNNYSPKTACFGIAGPVENSNAKITNLNWEISEFKLKKNFNFEMVDLINDFAVLIYGIPYLHRRQYKTIQQGNPSIDINNKLHTIVGAGTGLGISRGIISDQNILTLPSEGGHVEFAPKTKEEWEIKQWLKGYLNIERVSNERIISGEGLSNIARWKFETNNIQDHPFREFLKKEKESILSKRSLAVEICKLSKQGDPLMTNIETIWFNAYSSYIGDVAIHELCFGGLWIAGGTAPKHFKKFISDSFLNQFSNKGRLKNIVKSIPIRVILDEEFGLHSAACRAKMLLNNNKK